jgi:hypothetical protein
MRDAVLEYKPRPQFLPFHNRKQRWAIIVAHRRAGKTVATINDLIYRALRDNKPDGRYAFVAPYYNQAKDLAWKYLKEYSWPVLKEPPRESELSVLLANGARIRLYGGDNPDRLRGIYLDGVVLDEYGDMIPALWSSVLRPALADRGGWATFIGTPKGKNAFWELWDEAPRTENWFTLQLKASETGILSKEEIADISANISPDEVQQELECSFEAAIRGAFYAEEMRVMLAKGRICEIEIDPDVLMYTAWDLGVSDSTAIWFIQCVGRERRLVDYYENSGMGLDHYAQVLHDRRMKHRFKYGEHYLPHDIKHRELTTGQSGCRSPPCLIELNCGCRYGAAAFAMASRRVTSAVTSRMTPSM